MVSTIGSIIALDPALDLSIDAQYSGMSGGQFNMQFSVQLYNQTAVDFAPTLYMVVVNSGIFVTESGSSAPQTGLLNQEMVLKTKSEKAVVDSHTYDKSIVGGSIENIGAVHKHLKKALAHATSEKQTVIDEDGAGMSAGAMSAGTVLTGAKRRIHKYATN